MAEAFTCPECGGEEWLVAIKGELDDPDSIIIQCVECREQGGWVMQKPYDA